MSKTTHRKNHKEKLNQFKQTLKKPKMSNNQEQVPQVPETRQTPVWKSTDTIEMNGLEFQEIFNFMNNLNGPYMAVHSVLNRNLLNGTVKMQFEKLNADKTGYEPMTEEEQAPLQKEFQDMINQANDIAKSAVLTPEKTPEITADEQKDLPRIDSIVGPDGQPVK